MSTHCRVGGEHAWEIQDYVDPFANAVMKGPICVNCGALGEYVLPGGWQEALRMVTDSMSREIDQLVVANELSDAPCTLVEQALRQAREHLRDANRQARK